MEKSDWKEAKRIFQEAIELEPGERRDFISANCADVALHGDINNLLEAYEASEGFIEQPAVSEMGFPADEYGNGSGDAPRVSQRIGNYQITREIGKGGMGNVFLATRDDGEFSQSVAIKIIKRGMDTDLIVRRFRNERQILASLNHPFITRLLDGGTTDDGLPYLVMEYVEGMQLMKFCEKNSVGVEERLDLFRQICSAVEYAHRNLVVHRDLKPSNILVTADGSPKLLDFGIAKLTQAVGGTGDTTGSFARLFTPEYASPEQIRGENITTVSDVYSLGVVLYELLTGQHPVKRGRNLAPHEWMKEICDTEPQKPSDAVGARTGRLREHNTERDAEDTRHLSAQPVPTLSASRLRGDLDNIVLKALQKEPSLRYASVEQFSEDIRRHQNGLPVIAQTSSAGYRARKFISRHRLGAVAGALIFLSLLVGTSVAGWQAYRANRERAKAENRFNQVRKLAHSVIFDYHDGIQKLAGSTEVREKMVRDAVEYLDNLSADGGNDAALLSELAAAYEKVGDVQGNPYLSNLGNLDGAIDSYQKGLAIRESLFAANPNDPDAKYDLGQSYSEIGDIYWAKGNNEEAMSSYVKALSVFEGLKASDPGVAKYQAGVSYALNGIGHVQQQQGDFKGELETFKKLQANAEETAALGPGNASYLDHVAVAALKLGDAYMSNGDLQNALPNYQRSITIFSTELADDKDDAGVRRRLSLAFCRIGRTESQLGQYDKAAENDLKALEMDEYLLKQDPGNNQLISDISTVNNNLADDYLRQGKLGLAEKYVKDAISQAEQTLSKSPDYQQARENYAGSCSTYAQVLEKKLDHDGAIKYYLRSNAILENEDSRNSQTINLAQNYLDLGDIHLLLARRGGGTQASSYLRTAGEWYRKCLDALASVADSDTDKATLAKSASEHLAKLSSAGK